MSERISRNVPAAEGHIIVPEIVKRVGMERKRSQRRMQNLESQARLVAYSCHIVDAVLT